MATNRTYVEASPEAVWRVLADPTSYAHWVVGSSRTRHVSGRWPARGSAFHHTQGLGPIGIRDNTEVIEVRRPSRLLLEVRIRPFLVGRVEMGLERHRRGTWLTMVETPSGGLFGRVAGPLLDPLIGLRNVESLRRLRRLAEQEESRAAG